MGYVYILTNPAMPNMVKVGMTTDSPEARAKTLSSTTGVPQPFRVAWYASVDDCAAVEGAVKRALNRHRVNGRREFFAVTVQDARRSIEAAAAGRIGRGYFPRLRTSLWKRRRQPSLYQYGAIMVRLGLFVALALAAIGWF